MNNVRNSAIAVGIDLVDIDRIRKLHKKYGNVLMDKLFSEEEQRYCLSKSDPYPHLAARFAAKEAVAKAFGCGIGSSLSWTSIAVTLDNNGAPGVLLSSIAQKKLKRIGGQQCLISLTHTKTLAQAIALIV